MVLEFALLTYGATYFTLRLLEICLGLKGLMTAARTSHSSIHLGVDQKQVLVHHDDQARIDEAAVITVSTRNPKGPLPSSLGSNDLRSGLDQVLVTRRPLSFSLRTNVLSAALEQVLIHRGYCW